MATLAATARVALIRSNVVMMPQSLSFWGPVPPIGLAYIAAAQDRRADALATLDEAHAIAHAHEAHAIVRHIEQARARI